MSNKKICFIGQFAPPIHGLSKALETLYNSKLAERFELYKVNITNNKKILNNLIKIYMSKCDLYYFTISQSKLGNIRDLIILKLLELQKKKCIIHLHGGYYRSLVDNDMNIIQKKLNYKAIKKLDGAIVLSNLLKSNFEGMIDSSKIFVVENCIDDEYLISDKDFREKLQNIKCKDIYNIVYLSNFIKSKGYLEVLELARIEKERCDKEGEKKRFHFNFAGQFFKEDEKVEFFEYIQNFNLNDFITYHGVVTGKEKLNLLKNGDIFILLTKYPNEGVPISILESMGNGMFVVTTNHAGIPDIVKDCINGLICNKNQINENIENIYNSLYYEDKYEKVISYNRNEIKEKYSESRYINNMKNIFEKYILE